MVKIKLKIIFVHLTILLGFLSCTTKSTNESYINELSKLIDDKMSMLDKNFRNKISIYEGKMLPIQDWDSLFLRVENQNLDFIQKEMEVIMRSLELDPILNEDIKDAKLLLLLNKLKLVHEIERRTLLDHPFNRLEPKVVIVNENDLQVDYNILLTASDEKFVPDIQIVYGDQDTLNILVDDRGIGVFSIMKNYPSEKHSFKGDLYYYSSQGERLKMAFSH